MNVADPVFLITGASSGIGAATARAATAGGYRVVLAARSQSPLEALAGELGGPDRALALTCDVTEWDDQQRVVEAALSAFGQLDVAFANAGFGGARGFLEESPEQWKRMLLTNVYGAALTVRATVPALREARGHLLLTGSVAGRRALPGSLFVHEVGDHGHGRGRPPRAQRQRRARDHRRAGHGRHAVFEEPKPDALKPEDIARAVMFAVSQPPHVDVNEILIRPTSQET